MIIALLKPTSVFKDIYNKYSEIILPVGSLVEVNGHELHVSSNLTELHNHNYKTYYSYELIDGLDVSNYVNSYLKTYDKCESRINRCEETANTMGKIFAVIIILLVYCEGFSNFLNFGNFKITALCISAIAVFAYLIFSGYYDVFKANQNKNEKLKQYERNLYDFLKQNIV